MKLFGANRLHDTFQLKLRADGTAEEPCWFCGGVVIVSREGTSDAAAVAIEPLGGDGERMHGICHASCAERARGSLRL